MLQGGPNYDPVANGIVAWDVYREMWGSSGEFVIDGNLRSAECGDRLNALRVSTLMTVGDLPDAGHHTSADQAAVFLRAVSDFLKK